MTLVEPAMGTSIEGIEMPKEAYWVVSAPAPLVGMKFPRAGFLGETCTRRDSGTSSRFIRARLIQPH
jgi:hypothetical protein